METKAERDHARHATNDKAETDKCRLELAMRVLTLISSKGEAIRTAGEKALVAKAETVIAAHLDPPPEAVKR